MRHRWSNVFTAKESQITVAAGGEHSPLHLASSVRFVNRAPTTKLVPTIIVAIFVIAALVRGMWVADDYLTRDEAFSWRLIQYPVTEMLARTAEDVHPPLYYLLLKGWGTVFGQSILALRGMSILLALGTVPLLMATVREACVREAPRQNGRDPDHPTRAACAGALLAAALFAVHTSQIYPARDARMYSLGVFLAVLTSWLLLRALRSERSDVKWWLAYGVAVGAFCHTHNYAFFTVAGQCVFVAGDLIRQVAKGLRSDAFQQAQGFVMAGALALAIYSPWVPALLHQVQDVREGYWIPEVNWQETQRVLASWTGGATVISYNGGSQFVTDLDINISLGAVALLMLATVALRDRAMWFFLLLAAVPWMLALGISMLGDRSIFHERYLVFAQVFWLGLWGVLFERVRLLRLRAGMIRFLIVTVLYNSALSLTEISRQRAPGLQAMQFVREQYDPETDVIIADSYRKVNQLLCLANEAGIKDAKIRAIGLPRLQSGHTTHVASLSDSDFIRREDWPACSYRRIWLVSESLEQRSIPLPLGMQSITQHQFTRDRAIRTLSESDQYGVMLYARPRARKGEPLMHAN